MKAYLAGSIFYIGDEYRNTAWAKKLRETFPNMDLYNPLEAEFNGVEGKKRFGDSRMIAEGDNKRLDDTDVFIVCLDGDVLPAGSCAEVSRFATMMELQPERPRVLIAIMTDNRQCFLTHSEEKDKGGYSELGEQQYSYQNLYVTGVIKLAGGKLVSNIDDAIDYLKTQLYKFE